MGNDINKLYTFFGALEIVAGTNRRVKYKNSSWLSYERENKRNSSASLVEDKTDTWWPLLAQQKERAWRIEPKKQIQKQEERRVDKIIWRKFDKKQMEKTQQTYLVHRKGCFPECAVWRYNFGEWRFKRYDGVILDDVHSYCRLHDVPIPIEESEKSKDIFVWGIQEGDMVFIYGCCPEYTGKYSFIPKDGNTGSCVEINELNLFPENEPKKYKLVEVKENEREIIFFKTP